MFALALPALQMLLPMVASGFVKNETTMQYVNIALGVVVAGINVKAKLEELNSHIETMVEEERDPTEEEWAALLSRSDAAHDRIQGA
jgi:hypothetical protein